MLLWDTSRDHSTETHTKDLTTFRLVCWVATSGLAYRARSKVPEVSGFCYALNVSQQLICKIMARCKAGYTGKKISCILSRTDSF